MWTPYGIRTQSINSENYNYSGYHQGSIWPHDNWIIAQGLKACGYSAYYQKVKAAMIRVYSELNSIPELYAVNAANKLVPLKISNSIQYVF